MKQYWPMAIYDSEKLDAFKNTLHTYDSSCSLDVATKVFFLWSNAYGYKIIHAWIDVFEEGQKTEQIEYYKDEEALVRAEQRWGITVGASDEASGSPQDGINCEPDHVKEVE